MNNDKNNPDRDEPLSPHVTRPDDVTAPNTADCPLCGTPAEIIYGFGDGPQRGRLHCPSCGPVDWPPRAC
jgi:hypothetical protein